MSKARKKVEAEVAEAVEAWAGEGLAVDDLVERIKRETCTGDLRDFLLDRLKHDKNPLPWNMRTELEQREMIEAAERAANLAVERIVRLVAADGKRALSGTLVQFGVKKGVEAKLRFASDDDTLVALNGALNGTVQVVIADASAYTGETNAALPQPDEPEMFDEDGVIGEADGGQGSDNGDQGSDDGDQGSDDGDEP